jgi:adhesin/invasin
VDGGGNGLCGRNVFYIFARSGTNWVLQSEVPLTQYPDAYYDKWFDISGSTMVLGLPDASVENAQFQGTAYVYDLPPQVSVASVVNGATFQAPVAPGALATIFGNNFAGPDTLASTVPLPTTINGVSVLVNGTPAPLIFVGSKQINFQIPYETMPGDASVVVSVNGNSSAATSFTVSDTAPGIFVYGSNRANIQNQDHSLNDQTHPAKVGAFVVIWATGLGQMDHPVPTGEATPASPLSNALVVPTVTVGGVNAEVSFAGLAPGFVGLAQINVKVPNLATGEYPVVVTQEGQMSNSPVMNVSR